MGILITIAIWLNHLHEFYAEHKNLIEWEMVARNHFRGALFVGRESFGVTHGGDFNIVSIR
jgi:hypothetical protein